MTTQHKEAPSGRSNEQEARQGFTPGPLHVGGESRDGVFGVLLPSGYSVGCAYREEDARLWAAAPELLGALIQVRARFQNLRLGPDEAMTLDRVNAAIAKATGA